MTDLRCPNCPALYLKVYDEIIVCCPYCGGPYFKDTFREVSEEEAQVMSAYSLFVQLGIGLKDIDWETDSTPLEDYNGK